MHQLLCEHALDGRELLVWTGRAVRALWELRGRGAPEQPERQRPGVQLIGSDAQQREGPASSEGDTDRLKLDWVFPAGRIGATR